MWRWRRYGCTSSRSRSDRRPDRAEEWLSRLDAEGRVQLLGSLKVCERWGLTHVVWVGDRGLLTDARFAEELRPVEGLEWITALGSPAIGARLDGVYVIRTSVRADEMEAAAVVRSYRDLSQVGWGFRDLKTVHLEVRPIRRALPPLLFQEDDPAGAQAERRSIVAPARGSARATFPQVAQPTPLQKLAFELLDVPWRT